ncbi:hypothetical protein [Ornithinimicrobium kibberense]|uniref:hypothetical protein n=1 Tax=Ornithinimicrobium kibberense TaxID=282060 RepID=UPI003610458C
MRPACRIRSTVSSSLTSVPRNGAGAGRSTYSGRAMPAGTGRRGLIFPGARGMLVGIGSSVGAPPRVPTVEQTAAPLRGCTGEESVCSTGSTRAHGRWRRPTTRSGRAATTSWAPTRPRRRPPGRWRSPPNGPPAGTRRRPPRTRGARVTRRPVTGTPTRSTAERSPHRRRAGSTSRPNTSIHSRWLRPTLWR